MPVYELMRQSREAPLSMAQTAPITASSPASAQGQDEFIGPQNTKIILTDPSFTSSQPLPLSRENLRLLNGDMAPQTTPEESLESLSSKQTSKQASSTTKGLGIHDLLELNQMPIDSPTVMERQAYQDAMAFAQRILSRQGISPTTEGFAKDMEALRRKYAHRNEQTFIIEYFWPLMGKGRHVEGPEERPWKKDGLDINSSQPFLREALPKVDAKKDKLLERLLSRHERVKNPVPDVLYGLSKESFSDAEETVNKLLNVYTGISSGIRHPAVIVEFKTGDSIEEVEAQCARAGAALVNSTRQLLVAAGENILTPGADVRTPLFSFAFVPSLAQLSIHWAEVTDDKSIIFHMHPIEQYGLRVPNGGGALAMRRSLNNILEWIVGERKDWIKQLLAAIAQREREKGMPRTIESKHKGAQVGQASNSDNGLTSTESTMTPASKKRRKTASPRR
ncbi:MAG: hypothetical protein Q9217_002217 [Psora testacea]